MGEFKQYLIRIAILFRQLVAAVQGLVFVIGGDQADYNCKIKIASGQAIPDDTLTKVALATKVFDPENMASVANYDITIPRSGYYLVSSSLLFDNPNAAGRYFLEVQKNGALLQNAGQDAVAASAGKYPNPNNTECCYLEKGDVLTLWAKQNSGASKNLFNNQQTFLSVAKINRVNANSSSDNSSDWISADENWTYASASTITVPSGALSRYQKGDRIKWTQSSIKYGTIIAVADTLLAIAVNNDYVVSNAPIYAPYYSRLVCPFGYPTWFNYTPTFGGFSVSPTIVACRYRIFGSFFSMAYRDVGGTSNGTTFTISCPVAALVGSVTACISICTDNGSRFGPASAEPSLVGGAFYLYKSGALTPFTNSGGKGSEAASFFCAF